MLAPPRQRLSLGDYYHKGDGHYRDQYADKDIGCKSFAECEGADDECGNGFKDAQHGGFGGADVPACYREGGCRDDGREYGEADEVEPRAGSPES